MLLILDINICFVPFFKMILFQKSLGEGDDPPSPFKHPSTMHNSSSVQEIYVDLKSDFVSFS
jgi:hypothetical protein